MSTKLLNRVRSLVERGERLSVDDCAALFEVKDLIALAKLARVPRDRRHGRRAFYRPAHLVEYRGENPEFFISEAETSILDGASIVAIRTSASQADSLDAWCQRLRTFSRGRIEPLLLVSPGFIASLADGGNAYDEILDGLRNAGSIQLTGEGAELFDAAYRRQHAPDAIEAEEWIEIHRVAHGLGIATSAAMTYTVEDQPALYAAHMETLRLVGDRSGGFAQFVPMAMHDVTTTAWHLAAPTAAQTLRLTAIARLFLDNIPHIAAAPSLVTAEVAVVALDYGADTIETTVVAGDVESRSSMPVGDLMVIDESNDERTSLSLVRDRINEARWTPVELGVGFDELERA